MASPSGPANRSGPVAPMVLVTGTAIVVIECARALFSLTYKVGESIGFLVAGLVVVALFASPVVAPVLRRLVPPRALLLGAVGLLAAGRLVVQVMVGPRSSPSPSCSRSASSRSPSSWPRSGRIAPTGASSPRSASRSAPASTR